jgi:hypothetical protein
VLARFRLAVIGVVLAALLAGAISVLTGTARAGTARASGQQSQQSQQCQSRSVPASCSFGEEIQMPLTIAVTANAAPEQGQPASVSWTVSCSVNGADAKSTSGSTTTATPFSTQLTLPGSEGADCTVNASITLHGTGSLIAKLIYSLGKQVMISVPADAVLPSSPLAMFKCLTDLSDSKASGAKVVLGDCTTVYAGMWTYTGKLLVHRGLCLTDPRNGGIRTKLLLERCAGSADQTWSYRQEGQTYTALVLKAHDGTLCLDDPKYSVANGTPLIVFTCNGGPDQEWTFS